MSIVVDTAGSIWQQCNNPECPDLEHPEDLHYHQILAGVPLRKVRAMAQAELWRRGRKSRAP